MLDAHFDTRDAGDAADNRSPLFFFRILLLYIQVQRNTGYCSTKGNAI
jgi:arginase family enzyme